MLPTLRLSLVTLCLVTMATVGSGETHVESAIVEALYHSSVNFSCRNPHGVHLDLAIFSPGQLRRLWILPNDDLLEAGMTHDHQRVDILDDGATLHVRDVDDEDFGWYYCLIHVSPADQYLLQKHGLNVHGAYWGDLYEQKYKPMVTTGVIAGAICFVAMGLLCFLYGRQQGKLDQLAEEEKAAAADIEARSNNGKNLSPKGDADTQKPATYTNYGYEADENSPRPPKGAPPIKERDSSLKGPAPAPPLQQELRDVAAAADDSKGDAAGGGGGGTTRL